MMITCLQTRPRGPASRKSKISPPKLTHIFGKIYSGSGRRQSQSEKPMESHSS